MKMEIIQTNEAKTRKAAINQAVYFLSQQETLKRRSENIMSNSNKVTDKISKLQDTLREYEKQLAEIDTTSANWETLLKDIKSKWNLTEAEILELKSSLLRSQIASLEKEAGIQKVGTKLV